MTIQNKLSEIWYTRCGVPTPVALTNGPELHRHLGIGLEPELIDAVSRYKDFLYQWGFLADDFNINDWLDRRPWAAFDVRAAS